MKNELKNSQEVDMRSCFSLFQSLTTNKPSTPVTLQEVYRLITTDVSLKESTEKYRYFRAQGFDADADKIKRSKCWVFTPAARFNGKRHGKNLVEYTQYSMVDIDKLEDGEAEKLIKLLKDDSHWLLAYITLSGKGLRIIFKVEGVTDNRTYLKAFYQGNDHYCRLLGITRFDSAVKDATRGSVLCHDPNAFFRQEAEPLRVDEDKVVVAEVWEAIEINLERRGYSYREGHRNEYISKAGYLLNGYGVEEDEAVEWLQRRFPDYDPNRTESHIRSCYSNRTDEHGKLHPGNRPKVSGRKISKTQVEAPKYLSVEEIEATLAALADFRWNEITRMTEICWKDGEEGFRPMTDRDEGTLWSRINKRGKPLRMKDMQWVLGSEFVPVYHPFKDYFYGLPKWKEGDTDHIAALAATVLLVDDSVETRNMFHRCLKKWLVGMIAGFLSDRVNHEILVLIGKQGIYKTTWFHFLLPPELRNYYVAKNNSRRMSKDDRLLLAEAGLICLEEIVSMTDEEVDQIKAAVSLPQVVERAAYARNKEVRPHLASFCGTGNHLNFLTDITGNRRWLPFEVENILSPYDHPLDYTGLYSQVMYLWQSGFAYWFNQEEIRALSKHVSRFEAPNLEEDQIRKHFRIPEPGELYEVYSVADVLSVINLEQKVVLSPTKVGMLLSKMGYRKVRTSRVRGYMMYRYSEEEIHRNRRMKTEVAREQKLSF